MLEKIFTEAVHQYFSALAEKHNLIEIHSSMDNVVSYENDKIRLEICFDSRRSYELGINIINKTPETPHYWDTCFDLSFILKIRAAQDLGAVGSFQTSNPDFIPKAVKILAYSTERYAADLLKGSQNSFRELANIQKIETHKYNLEQSLWYARRAAEKAWISKDYVGVIKAYKPLEGELTPAEMKKLYYCEKNCFERIEKPKN